MTLTAPLPDTLPEALGSFVDIVEERTMFLLPLLMMLVVAYTLQ